MRKQLFALVLLAALSACSSNTTPRYDFKPYRYAHNVSFWKVQTAVEYLVNEKQNASFKMWTGGYGLIGNIFEADLPYDNETQFHVYLYCVMSKSLPLSETTYEGKITLSSSPDASFHLQAIVQCGFWGELDWDEAKKENDTKYESDGCGCHGYYCSLVYPEVDCDRGGYELLPHDIIDFMRMSLFENMITPIQEAMDELGIIPDGVITCACPT